MSGNDEIREVLGFFAGEDTVVLPGRPRKGNPLNRLLTFISKKEPAAVGAMITAALGLAVTFGWNLTPTQVGSITSFLVVAYGLWTRQEVWSDDTHREEVRKALKIGAGGAGGAAGAAAGAAVGSAVGEVVESTGRGLGGILGGVFHKKGKT